MISRLIIRIIVIGYCGIILSAKANDCLNSAKHFSAAPEAKAAHASIEEALRELSGENLKKAFGVYLKHVPAKRKLSQNEITEQVLALINLTGHSPDLITRKDVLEKGRLKIAYPMNLPGKRDHRMVFEYTVRSSNKGEVSSRRGLLAKAYVSTYNGKKIKIIEDAVDEVPESQFFVAAKKHTKELSEFIQGFTQSLVKMDTENPNAPQVTELLNTFKKLDSIESITSHEKELRKMLGIIESTRNHGGHDELKAFMPAGGIHYVSEIHPDVLDGYLKFMEDYFYSPNRNTFSLRDQEQLQNLTDITQLKKYSRKLVLGNFREWVKDRSTRQIGAIPVGIAIGYFMYKLNTAIDDEEESD